MQENVSFSENYLKCRAKILGTEKWVEGFVIPQTTKDQELHSFMVITNVMAPGSLSKQDMIEIDPDTICRHTGYQKNGLKECPEGHPYCTGDCFYYSEDPEERIAKGEEHWDLE